LPAAVARYLFWPFHCDHACAAFRQWPLQ